MFCLAVTNHSSGSVQFWGQNSGSRDESGADRLTRRAEVDFKGNVINIIIAHIFIIWIISNIMYELK